MDIFLNSKTIQKVFLLSSRLNSDNVIKLAENKKLINKLMIYVVIDKLKDCECNEETINLMYNLINKLYNNDNLDFFKQIFDEFAYNKLFNYAFGYFLSKLNNKNIENILNNCFEIKKTNPSICKRKLLDVFEENVDENKLSFFLSIFYEKWCSFIKNTINDTLALDSKLLITNYDDYVLRYYCYCCSNEIIIRDLKFLFLELKNLDSKWFHSKLSYNDYFFVCLTQIIILSYAYEYKKLNDYGIKDLFIQFKENKIVYQKFSLNKLDVYIDDLDFRFNNIIIN